MLKTVDLFAGAGGLSLGFHRTGKVQIVAAAEINRNASKTYMENFQKNNGGSIELIENIVGYDFRSLIGKHESIDLVIGGPPCQGFSNANRQKNHVISMNNILVKEYFRAIKELRPRAFVMENVSMLQSDTHRFYDSSIDHDEVMRYGKNFGVYVFEKGCNLWSGFSYYRKGMKIGEIDLKDIPDKIKDSFWGYIEVDEPWEDDLLKKLCANILGEQEESK